MVSLLSSVVQWLALPSFRKLMFPLIVQRCTSYWCIFSLIPNWFWCKLKRHDVVASTQAFHFHTTFSRTRTQTTIHRRLPHSRDITENNKLTQIRSCNECAPADHLIAPLVIIFYSCKQCNTINRLSSASSLSTL